MENFINLGKQYLESRSHENVSSQEQVHKTGGHEFNSPDNRPPPGYGGSQGYQGGGYGQGRPQLNDDEVVSTASREGSGDSSLFSSALSFLSNNKDEHERPIDEQEVQNAHRKAYDEDKPSELPASSLGSAAAMQILKQFTSGGSSGGSHTSSSSSSGGTSQLISMAMAEASKLFDKSGGQASGNKQDAVNSAAMTVMKLLVQSKFKQTTGGSDSGGLGQLMGLASKFM